MNRTGVDVARFSIVRSAQGGAPVAIDTRSGGGLWFARTRHEHRDLLPLAPNLESFLYRLGARIRRNVRRSEKIAARHGLCFAWQCRSRRLEIGPDVLAVAARNRPVPVPAGALATFERLVANCSGGFESRITREDGSLLSLCRGVVKGRTAYLVYQLNDPAIPGLSLSLLHRIRLIEELIGSGVREMIFVGECSGPLKAACQVSSKEDLIAIRPSIRGLMVALMVAVSLRGTWFGEAVKQVLAIIARHWAAQMKDLVAAIREFTAPGPGRKWRYAVSALIGLLSSAGAVSLGVALRSDLKLLPYMTAYPALALATYLAGAWAGLLTIALGGAGILYFVIPPYDSFAFENTRDVWITCIYGASATLFWFWLTRYERPPTP